MEILDRSGEFNHYADLILKTYQSASPESDAMWELESSTVALAKRVYPGAEDILFEVLDRAPVNGKEYYSNIFDVNSGRAFDLLSRRIMLMPDEQDRLDSVERVVDHLFEGERRYHGVNLEAIETTFSNHLSLLPYVRQIVLKVKERREDRPESTRPRRTYTYEGAKATMNDPRVTRGLLGLRGYGRRMDKDSILALARDFQQETRPEIIRPYIGIFAGARYPLGHKRILQHLQDEDADFRRIVILALSLIRHPSLHKLSMQLYSEGRYAEAISLLESNFQPADVGLLVNAMSSDLSIPDWQLHQIGNSIIDGHKLLKSPFMVPALFAVYEHTPCSVCRGWTAEQLLSQNSMPNWMRVEGEHDSGREDHIWNKPAK
jgi:hypothetical protein